MRAARIGARQADVVKSIVAETPADVTNRTVGLAVEQLEAGFGGVGNRCIVAVDPAVERSGSGQHGALERGDSGSDGVDGNGLPGIGLREHPYIARNGL